VFIIEALPAIALAFVVWFVMTDRPAVAAWLAAEERDWLAARLDEERRTIDRHHGVMSLFESLRDPRVLALSAIYFCGVTANYGIVFFMPQIVKAMGLSNLMTGFVASVPYIVGTIGLIAWGYSSDRHQERRWHLIVASLVAAAGLVAAGWLGSSFWALMGMSAATIGIYGSRAAFWPMPSLFLTGTAAAGAIALINATGNLGGYVGPFVVGWIKDSTNSFEAGLYFLAASALGAAVITYFATAASGRRAEPTPAGALASR
jgi:ACS family tartrate transporter-like MFS transporter